MCLINIIIDIIKPLSNVISNAINKSPNIKRKINGPWECGDLSPGLLGERQVCYLCAVQQPETSKWFNALM